MNQSCLYVLDEEDDRPTMYTYIYIGETV